MAVRIVTDSSADLPQPMAQQWNITVLPCYVIIDDKAYRDGVDLSADAFYHRLTADSQFPSTAQPSVADFQTAYKELLDQGHYVVSIHISRKLSGTINSAEQARATLGEDAASRLEIIDSGLASIPLGLVVLAAAQQAETTQSHVEIAGNVRRHLPAYHCYFVLDTLTYLQRGGRIGRAQAFLGSVLNVKPILTIKDGLAHPVERVRNKDRSIRRLVELVQRLAPIKQLAVSYSTDSVGAETLKSRLSHLLTPKDIVVTRFGPTLGTYIGPGGLGVALASGDEILSS